MVPTHKGRFDLKRLKEVIDAAEICGISTKKPTTYLELCGDHGYTNNILNNEDACNDA